MLTSLVLAQGIDQSTSVGEAVAFWILGPIALLGALGLIFARSAVHSALFLAMTMFSLGVLYMVQQAPFLGFTQIIVYTGAIMMLFLFVLMLVGRESSDSVVEVLRGQRLWAGILGIGIAGLIVTGLLNALSNVTPAPAPNGTPSGLGRLIFTNYLFAFELTSALLITAALGAMVLAFNDRRNRRTQKELVEARFRGEYERISPKPGPGVFATSHSVMTPALLPDGTVAQDSLSAIIESTPAAQLDAERKRVEGKDPQPDAHALTGSEEKE
ncbi:NADH-quinone oxidoreductase subunit J [Amycolatopsis sp. GM8]|uniref:NADH-quinone oxidoreductase subunit J n=1 Tax=Amycolatopsis sp. GM8 TaxID=2896530 RepID=UPI001F002248|nr:NADH-quinone oxidoreductase subunit J [Amycolatopsis sp. GM8]